MDKHLDTHYADTPIAFDELGKIADVLCKDHTRNDTGNITLYDVTIYPQKPSLEVTLPAVQILGQMSGQDEGEDPLSVGDWVVVRFLGGDAERPYIAGRWQNQETTAVAQTTAQHPRTRIIRRGVAWEVDKDGKASLQLKEDQSFKLLDSNGAVLLEVIDNGGGYEVHLGGNAGLLRLLTENTIGSLKGIWNGVTPVPNDGGAAIKAAFVLALDAAFTTANSTDITRAK